MGKKSLDCHFEKDIEAFLSAPFHPGVVLPLPRGYS